MRAFFLAMLCVLIGCATTTQPFDDFDGGTTPTDSASCSTFCNNVCVDTKTDPANCGKCGTSCPATATCVQGSCQCPSGATKCGNACVDVKSDNANCGKCGSTCGGADAGTIMGGGTWSCVSGSCAVVCPMGKTACGGACVDTKTDIDNCGMCGTVCGSMEQCTEGLCCPTGQKACNNMCTDVMGDPKNCGMCGNQCPMNMPSCSMGKCTTSMLVQIFPPSGTLQDPGSASVWGGRYYIIRFNQQRTILAVDWRAALGVNDTMRAGIWNPGNQQKLATGNSVNGNGSQQFYRSTISFTAQANTDYLVGIWMSNVNTVFPRKDSPSFPFTTNGITVSACRATNGSTDVFPTSVNIWGPDFRLEIQ